MMMMLYPFAFAQLKTNGDECERNREMRELERSMLANGVAWWMQSSIELRNPPEIKRPDMENTGRPTLCNSVSDCDHGEQYEGEFSIEGTLRSRRFTVFGYQ